MKNNRRYREKNRQTSDRAKLLKLRIIVIFSFVMMLCGAVTAIVCWGITYKPFEKFAHYDAPLVFGNTFDIEEVNIVQLGQSTKPYRYEYHYYIDGKTYVKTVTRWSSQSFSIQFDYLVSDPDYTVASRTLAIVALPITSILLIGMDVFVVFVYRRERERFREYNYKFM